MTDTPSRSPGAAAGNADESSGQGSGGVLQDVLKHLFRPRGNGSARAEIEDALAEDEARGDAFSAFSAEERAMLRAVLKLGDMRVDDVMVPRADIEAVDVATPIAELLSAFREAGHSRMPVYRDNLDDPVGMVHIKDVMAWIVDTAVAAKSGETPQPSRTPDLAAVDLRQTLQRTGMVRPILFVPPSMPARMLLERMQASRTQMALVIDEYGGTHGLVSLEDLVEIIVGEIEDEHDLDDEPAIQKVADGTFIADARTPVEDARALIGPAFRVGELEEDVETIGGLVFTALGRIPARGEIVHAVEGFDFEVLDADPRRIRRIRIRERRKPKVVPRTRARPAADGEAQARPAAEPAPAPPPESEAGGPTGARPADAVPD